MLKVLLLSSCLLLNLSSYPFLNNENSNNRSHKQNCRKNHDCGYTKNNVLSKQAIRDIAAEKKANYQSTKTDLHALKGPASHLLNLLEAENNK